MKILRSIGTSLRDGGQSISSANKLTLLTLIAITAITDWRLIDSGLASHLFDFGQESLHAVQAWENHGFWSMAGLFSWGQGYLPADTPPQMIYQSKTPLHLLHLWGAYKLFGTAGFPTFKLVFSLAVTSLNGLLLGWIALLCFPKPKGEKSSAIPPQLIFVCTYALTISNESMLRYCLVDEPDYLGLTFWLATVASLGWWLQQEGVRSQHTTSPRLAMALGLLTSWTYPILGAINVISLFLLQLVPMATRLRHGLRSLLPGAVIGIGFYWLQRSIAKLLIPAKLYGSKLMDRMGLTRDLEYHDGVLDALDFLFDQRSGGIPKDLRNSQIYDEHTAIWVAGIVLFFIVMARISSTRSRVLLTLAAAEAWLFIPLLSQSVAMHGWVYGIHFMPSVVLGWVGAFSRVLPGHRTELFAPGALGFVCLLIWVIQLRWFLVAYLA